MSVCMWKIFASLNRIILKATITHRSNSENEKTSREKWNQITK